MITGTINNIFKIYLSFISTTDKYILLILCWQTCRVTDKDCFMSPALQFVVSIQHYTIVLLPILQMVRQNYKAKNISMILALNLRSYQNKQWLRQSLFLRLKKQFKITTNRLIILFWTNLYLKLINGNISFKMLYPNRGTIKLCSLFYLFVETKAKRTRISIEEEEEEVTVIAVERWEIIYLQFFSVCCCWCSIFKTIVTSTYTS